MLWIYYALATMASFAGADFFIKKASGKVDDFYGAVILNLAALVVPLIFFLYQKQFQVLATISWFVGPSKPAVAAKTIPQTQIADVEPPCLVQFRGSE